MTDVLSILVPAADLGDDPDQSDAGAFWTDGNIESWDGTPVPERGLIGLGFDEGFGIWPNYDLADATTTVAVYYQDYAGNLADGTEIPWDSSFVPATSGDAGLLLTDGVAVDMTKLAGYEFWRVYGTNPTPRPWAPLDDATEAFVNPDSAPGRGWTEGDLLVGLPNIREADLANVPTYQGHGGSRAPLIAGQIFAAEVQAAIDDTTWVIPHALTIAGFNPHNGAYAVTNDLYNGPDDAPGNRVEHADHAGVNALVDESPSSRLYKESCRLRWVRTEAQIDTWIAGLGLTDTALGNTKKVIAMTLAVMGGVVWETCNAYPQFYSDADPAWSDSLGVTSSGIAGHIIRGLATSADDIRGVMPTSLIVETLAPGVSTAPAQTILITT